MAFIQCEYKFNLNINICIFNQFIALNMQSFKQIHIERGNEK